MSLKRLDHPRVSPGSPGQEPVRLPVEEQNQAGLLLDRRVCLDLSHHRHTAHVLDLEVDHHDIGNELGDLGACLEGITEKLDLPVAIGEGGEDVVDDPSRVGDYQGQWHGGDDSERVGAVVALRLLTCRVVRRTLLTAAVFFIVVACSATGEPDEEPGIDVIDVSGPLDASALEFMNSSIQRAAETGQILAVLQVNSPAVLDDIEFEVLQATMANPPLPVAVWLGPAPAVAHGGAALIITEAGERAVSPGSAIGLIAPVVLGADGVWVGSSDPILWETSLPAEMTEYPQQPSIRQYLQDLNGVTFQTANGPVTIETIEPFELGFTLKPVTFRQPGFGVRFFRLAATPEAAFFFLVVGLAITSFEFFAIGPGVASAVAALSLILAGWGIVNLPVKPWALAAAVLGWVLLTAGYQKGGVFALTLLGAVMLQVGGTFFVDGSGQIDPRWYLVFPSVVAVLFFFLLAMPTVQRARFSTGTIGREGLIGEHGFALEGFDPDGVVEVRGARWRATAHREAGLGAGSEILVAGVDGKFLQVEPVSGPREN